jgi:hypothetical protein
MKARTLLLFVGTVALAAGCRDQPAPQAQPAEAQSQAPADAQQVLTDTIAQKNAFTPQLGMPGNDRVLPGTVGDGSVGAKVTVEIKNHKLTISQSQIAPGPASFSFTNSDDERHILEITYQHGGRWRSVPVGKGGGVVMSQSMQAGPYEIYCYVPGHRARGEHASFEVK